MTARQQTRRRRQVREQIEITHAAANQIQAVAGEIMRLQRRAAWGRVAWAIVAIQGLVLLPATVLFASVSAAYGGPIRGFQMVYFFTLAALQDLFR
jgi:hypothetical protein